MKTLSILVAEDDLDDRFLLRKAFNEIGRPDELSFVENGEELLLRLNGLPVSALPDLIFLDLNMPLMTGHEALELIKRDPQLNKIPVVVMSTSNEEGDRHRSYELGAERFLTKPASLKVLVTMLESALKAGAHWSKEARTSANIDKARRPKTMHSRINNQAGYHLSCLKGDRSPGALL